MHSHGGGVLDQRQICARVYKREREMIAVVTDRILGGATAEEAKQMLKRESIGSLAVQMSRVRAAVAKAGHTVPDGFRLTAQEMDELKRQRVDQKLLRQDNRIVVSKPEDILRQIPFILQMAAHTTLSHLILALTAVSGRRLTEIANGRSQFLPIDARPHHTLFHGQLKRRTEGQQAYIIPLLVPYTLFAHGLSVLRQRQGDVSNLTSEQVKNRFSGNANAVLHQGEFCGMPRSAHVHTLRAIYVKFVNLLWHCPWEENRLAMKLLGHLSIEESIVYVGSVSLQGGNHLRGAFGTLELPE